MIATERWFLSGDRSRVVREGDPAAAFLLSPKGAEVPPAFIKLVQAAMANTAAPDEPVRQTRVVKPLSRR